MKYSNQRRSTPPVLIYLALDLTPLVYITSSALLGSFETILFGTVNKVRSHARGEGQPNVNNTQGYHDTLHSRAWRPYTEAEVEFKTIEGTIEVSSKKTFKRGHLQPLYRPLKRPKLRSDSSPRCSKKQHKNLSFCTWSFTNTALVSYIVKLQ